MTMEELYYKIGGNYREVQTRLGNDKMIERFIKRFTQEKTIEQLKEAYDANDEKEIYNKICTFVEVCRSLSLSRMEETAVVIMEAYRPENAGSRDKFHVADLFDTLYEQYFNTITEIEKEERF